MVAALCLLTFSWIIELGRSTNLQEGLNKVWTTTDHPATLSQGTKRRMMVRGEELEYYQPICIVRSRMVWFDPSPPSVSHLLVYGASSKQIFNIASMYMLPQNFKEILQFWAAMVSHC
ncbi:hypothetical protein Sjap_025555 [Stephania japonica]|uniref:Uncharacterized protein n=1 Tax=Stephania japonica TaxID=461633 RepID=A0AAP0E1Z2_9MAGN